ncbi:MAG: hypothetical protein HYR55_07810 [Acidobacteria bacterium]|nr:hypothetical protein [Acidobacteriota bacterium]MBI3656870.1 hypothetical protein [Acidobacteriota bacterium]
MRKATAPAGKPSINLSDAVLHTNLTILEVAEPHLLEEIMADRRLAPTIVMRLSEDAAVVAPGQEEFFIKQLLKAGHTPKVVTK